jgi:hypothetical protein
MDLVQPDAALQARWFVLEDDAGRLYLLTPALLEACLVSGDQAPPLAAIVTGAELSGADARTVRGLLAPADGEDVRGFSAMAARRLRAWALIR